MPAREGLSIRQDGLICGFCEEPMTPDRRYRYPEVYRCEPCGVRVSVPAGYYEESKGDVTKRCRNPTCDASVMRAATGRPRHYCSARCRKAAQRLRRKSEELTEGLPAVELVPGVMEGG